MWTEPSARRQHTGTRMDFSRREQSGLSPEIGPEKPLPERVNWRNGASSGAHMRVRSHSVGVGCAIASPHYGDRKLKATWNNALMAGGGRFLSRSSPPRPQTRNVRRNIGMPVHPRL